MLCGRLCVAIEPSVCPPGGPISTPHGRFSEMLYNRRERDGRLKKREMPGVDTSLEASIGELEQKLSRSAEGHPRLVLTPAWWQQRLLDWANQDPDFRVKLLRFVDVLPTLRSAAAVADHVRQYFRDAGPRLLQTR